MTLFYMLPFLPVIAIILIIGSIIFRHPSEKLHHALSEGMLWGFSSIFAFGAEILLLARI